MAQNIAIERVDHIGFECKISIARWPFTGCLGLLWCAAPRATCRDHSQRARSGNKSPPMSLSRADLFEPQPAQPRHYVHAVILGLAKWPPLK
jgi:hypothetical protein